MLKVDIAIFFYFYLYNQYYFSITIIIHTLKMQVFCGTYAFWCII